MASDESPIRGVVTRSYAEFADDMRVTCDDGKHVVGAAQLAPCTSTSPSRAMAKVVERGNRVVPEVVREACREADDAWCM